jgi:hypothetical protein
MLTSLTLTFIGRQKEASVMDKVKAKQATQEKIPAPAPPAKPADKPAAPAAPTTPAK